MSCNCRFIYQSEALEYFLKKTLILDSTIRLMGFNLKRWIETEFPWLLVLEVDIENIFTYYFSVLLMFKYLK